VQFSAIVATGGKIPLTDHADNLCCLSISHTGVIVFGSFIYLRARKPSRPFGFSLPSLLLVDSLQIAKMVENHKIMSFTTPDSIDYPKTLRWRYCL